MSLLAAIRNGLILIHVEPGESVKRVPRLIGISLEPLVQDVFPPVVEQIIPELFHVRVNSRCLGLGCGVVYSPFK